MTTDLSALQRVQSKLREVFAAALGDYGNCRVEALCDSMAMRMAQSPEAVAAVDRMVPGDPALSEAVLAWVAGAYVPAGR